MAQLIDLGRLRFIYRGSYVASADYAINDVIRSGPASYIATASSTGVTPPNETYWQTLATGTGYEGEFDGVSTYAAGSIVSYGGVSYIAEEETSSTPSPTNSSWSVFSEGIKFEGIYSSASAYQYGDVVTYGANSYYVEQDTTGNAPTNTTYWSEFVPGLRYVGSYDSGTTYLKNDAVTSGGTTYIALTETTNNAPTTAASAGVWQILADGTFPTQTGNEGKFLSTTGSQTFWTSDVRVENLQVDERIYSGPSASLIAAGAQLISPITDFAAIVSASATGKIAQFAFGNAAPDSTSAFIVYAPDGYNLTNAIGMGISSEDSTGIPGFPLISPHDGFILMNTASTTTGNGDLIIGTGVGGQRNGIVFTAGGFNPNAAQMIITPNDNVTIDINTESTSPTTGALIVNGGAGIQGNLNVSGNVDIVGAISFGGSGTTVTTENLAVSDPLIFVGSNSVNDNNDTGLVGEYVVPSSSSAAINVVAVSAENNTLNVFTDVSHTASVGDVILVQSVATGFDGSFVVTDTASTTISYRNLNFNQTVSASPLTGTVSITGNRRWGGLIRDASDNIVRMFFGLETKPVDVIDFDDSSIIYTPIRIGNVFSEGLIVASDATGSVNIGIQSNFTSGSVVISGGGNSIDGSLNLNNSTVSGNPTFTGDPTFSGDPSFTGTPVFEGGVRVQEMIEDIVDVAHSSNTITLNYNDGNIFWLTNSLSASPSVIITNAPTDDGRIFTINLFVTQTSTGYTPNDIVINSASPSIKWYQGIVPSPTNSSGKIDIFTYTIIQRSGSYTALGSVNANF